MVFVRQLYGVFQTSEGFQILIWLCELILLWIILTQSTQSIFFAGLAVGFIKFAKLPVPEFVYTFANIA